jgi:indole-3-glycerol phosphate synthase
MFPVSESGIATREHAQRAALAGARALLVGEALVRAPADGLHAFIDGLKDPGWAV